MQWSVRLIVYAVFDYLGMMLAMRSSRDEFSLIKPSKSPNVADENSRSETPLSKRSINTTTKPRTNPSIKSGQRFPISAEEMFAPITAQKVKNKKRATD